MKIPNKFRAAKVATRVPDGGGDFQIEVSNGGAWIATMLGLDEAQVRKQFMQLEAHGGIIENTKDFTYKPEGK